MGQEASFRMLQSLNHFVKIFSQFLVDSTASDPRMQKESFADYVRFTGPGQMYYDNTLYSPYLDQSDSNALESLIDEQIAYFTPLKKNFEWKVYSFNKLHTLEKLLNKRGFKIQRASAVMYAPTDLEVKVKNPFDLIQAREWKDFEKIAVIQSNVYGERVEFLKDLQKETLLPDSRLDVYIAEQNAKALSAAWIRHYGDISFFFGGATLKEARGLGAYSSLVQRRITRASERGAKYVVSECSKDSEAVLERVGFRKAGTVNVFVHTYG